MKKFSLLLCVLLCVLKVRAQIQIIPVNQLLQNELNEESFSQKKQSISGHQYVDKSLGLTADQFVNGKRSVLCVNSESDLRKTTVQQSKAGRTHYRYQQTWNGIPIEGRYVLLHEENGILNSINGATVTGLSISTLPSLSERLALTKVLDTNVKYAWQIKI